MKYPTMRSVTAWQHANNYFLHNTLRSTHNCILSRLMPAHRRSIRRCGTRQIKCFLTFGMTSTDHFSTSPSSSKLQRRSPRRQHQRQSQSKGLWAGARYLEGSISVSRRARACGLEQGGCDRDYFSHSHSNCEDKQTMQCGRMAVGSEGNEEDGKC